MAISVTNHLLASVLVFWSPVISNVQNRTDPADYGKPCNKSEHCSSLGPEFWCHPEHRNCTCKGALLWFVSLHRCTEVALREECEASEQCIAYDLHSYCGEFGRSQLPPKICQCQFGFNMKNLNNQARCIEIPNAFGTPLFDSRDTVPIVMGCLAAGLALVACCAGIVQLLSFTCQEQSVKQCLQQFGSLVVRCAYQFFLDKASKQRIKQRSVPFRTGEPQDPHESVVLSLNQMLQPYADMIPFRVPTCNGTSPAVPYASGFYQTSTTIVEDMPPTYEEAVKDAAQILPPPSYMEHKPDE
ncbi:uncharacterized protein [Dermacentor albipictus]|uniref:uncharacterized protein isoform X2 n=1 Tax=Dermacentor albipictus TaxID=60249 RepID=UPI0038FCCD09